MKSDLEINVYINKHITFEQITIGKWKAIHHDQLFKQPQTMIIPAMTKEEARQTLFKKYKRYINYTQKKKHKWQ